MGIEAGKEVTTAINRLLSDAVDRGLKVTPGNDGSFQLLVEQSDRVVGVSGPSGRKEVSLSPESRQLLEAAVLRSGGRMRVRAYRRGGWPLTRSGQASLELSDPASGIGLEVVVDDADAPAPAVSTSLPRTYGAMSRDVVARVLADLMRDRIEQTQIIDAIGVVSVARMALGLGE